MGTHREPAHHALRADDGEQVGLGGSVDGGKKHDALRLQKLAASGQIGVHICHMLNHFHIDDHVKLLTSFCKRLSRCVSEFDLQSASLRVHACGFDVFLAGVHSHYVCPQATHRLTDQAAAAAEAQRLADLEAKRLAEADAEAQRLANLDTQRLAKLRADREAAEAAARQEVFELAKSREAERLRLAALKAQAEADAAEARRLEQVAAQAAADRLAAEKLLAEQRAQQPRVQQVAAPAPAEPKAAPAPKPEPIVFTAYEGPVPVPASYKPQKPAQLIRASYSPDEGKTVTRKAPAALTASKTDVRNMADTTRLQTPEAFLAGRIERTAAEPMPTEDMDLVRQAFRNILDNGADGSKQAIITPDSRTLTIVLERTVSREMGQSTVRTVTYTPGVSQVTRVVTEQAPVTVSVMCRDVAYAFAGQERGRFAACQAPEGGWTLARATDVVKVTTASLPNSAS